PTISRRCIASFFVRYLACLYHVLPLLFFHSHGHHLHLHSFPTRRSSDLPVRKVLLACVLECQVVAHHHHQGVFPGGVLTQALDKDRKSTRLNSSHVSISYAVFCLKKKNTTDSNSAKHCYRSVGISTRVAA